jgi:hypothetical protein
VGGHGGAHGFGVADVEIAVRERDRRCAQDRRQVAPELARPASDQNAH